ncbi:MAG: hypothetical protein HYY29_03830 [Chloroflexi bacterium]|nr:hypothetical protein [Chloroflexota bacterium]
MTKPYPSRDSLRCHAHSKNTGAPCKNWAMIGSTVCRLHGGKSLRGAEHPNFTGGRFSKYLPDSLRDKYMTALKDPELLQLRDDIALMDARLAELFEKLDKGESAAAWLHVAKAFKQLGSSEDAVREMAMEAMQEAIEKGVRDLESWQEIHTTVEQRRRLVTDEYKVQTNLKQMMTAEKAMALLALVADVVRRAVTIHCEDKKQAQRIMQAVSQELNLASNLKEYSPRLALQGAIDGQ